MVILSCCLLTILIFIFIFIYCLPIILVS